MPDMEKIGEGGEAEVFALDEHRVLRRFRQDLRRSLGAAR